MPQIKSTITIILILIITLISTPTSLTIDPHIIHFHSPSLYPEGMAWDPTAQHFIVGSLRHRTLHSVSDAGVVSLLLTDLSLPLNSTFLGLAVDAPRRRLLAAVHAAPPLLSFNALVAYDLRSLTQLFLSPLPSDLSRNSAPDIANDVALDFDGNAYVTNAGNNFIWKVDVNGNASFFSRSAIFEYYPVDRSTPWSFCGLNGVVFISKGYLLVVQSNTGKMFKVDAVDGTARAVILNKDLSLADDIAVRRDGVVLVVSMNKLWFIKSQDSWSEGMVFDETALDVGGFPTGVVVGGGGRPGRVYVLYGHVEEGIKGNSNRDWFRIEEVRSEKEGKEENVWVFVIIGLGLAYFLFWRFQMRQLVKKMDKKLS